MVPEDLPPGPAYRKSPPGARATPTLVGGRLYHLNGDGDVICLDDAAGKTIWILNMLKKSGGRSFVQRLENLLASGVLPGKPGRPSKKAAT